MEAWKKIESKAVAAVALDARFEGRAGKEILKRLSLSQREFPCVILCDYDFPVDELPSLSRAKVLTEPVKDQQVVGALGELLAK